MAYGSLGNYPGHGIPVIETAEGGRFIYIYNNTASAISNGAIYEMGTLVDYTDTDNPLIYAYPVAPATNDTPTNVVMVIDNNILDQSTIAAYGYGYACIRGVTTALVDGTADIAYGDQLEVINGGTAFISSGVASTSGASNALIKETCAISLVTYTTNSAALKTVFMLGRHCHVLIS
jgi:hypothetical protein